MPKHNCHLFVTGHPGADYQIGWTAAIAGGGYERVYLWPLWSETCNSLGGKKKKEKPLKKSSCEFFGLPLVGVLPLCSSEFFLSDPPQAQERWLFCVKLHDCKAGLSLSVKQKDVSWLKLAWQLQFKFPNLLWTVKLKSVFCWGDWMWLGCIWLLICNGSFRMQLIGTCWNVLIIPGV